MGGPAVAPGEMLLQEFLELLGLRRAEATQHLSVSGNRLGEIVLGKRRITADTAMRLSRFLKTSPQFWVRLQADWDLPKGPACGLVGNHPTRVVRDRASAEGRLTARQARTPSGRYQAVSSWTMYRWSARMSSEVSRNHIIDRRRAEAMMGYRGLRRAAAASSDFSTGARRR